MILCKLLSVMATLLILIQIKFIKQLLSSRTVYVIDDTWRQNLTHVTKKVVIDLEEAHVERPTINMVQSLVENRLMDAGYITIAEHYISYRLQRDLERNGYGDKIVVHLRFEQIK